MITYEKTEDANKVKKIGILDTVIRRIKWSRDLIAEMHDKSVDVDSSDKSLDIEQQK